MSFGNFHELEQFDSLLKKLEQNKCFTRNKNNVPVGRAKVPWLLYGLEGTPMHMDGALTWNQKYQIWRLRNSTQ